MQTKQDKKSLKYRTFMRHISPDTFIAHLEESIKEGKNKIPVLSNKVQVGDHIVIDEHVFSPFKESPSTKGYILGVVVKVEGREGKNSSKLVTYALLKYRKSEYLC